MKNLTKSAFISTMALLCYASFATAQMVSLDSLGDVSTLVKDLKFGGPGGFGGHGGGQVPPPSGPSHIGGGFGDHNGPGDHGGFPGGDHGGFPGNHGGDHNGPGDHGGFPGDHGGFPGDHGGFPGDHGGDHNGPGDHGGFPGDHGGPGPNPWHPQPGPQPWNPQPQPWNPQPQPWHPQPGPQPWHPHQDGHPDWDHNDWNNNQWNHHDTNGWWNNYDNWWNSSSHPFSLYRTACAVIPGVSAKGFIIEQTMPFNGIATFYFYDGFDQIIGASSPANGVYRGGDGTPVFDFYQVPQADHCFLAITQ
jgi:hypothetical protein